uniref:Radical SAM protein n=1 Tax=Candidatus Methanomethylicus mesodigestus TaxID=1867258 RepID=A0A7C3J544_9CREN
MSSEPSFGKPIALYRTSPSVFVVSITGKRCELACPHCEGRYLEGMFPATMPPDLMRSFVKAKSEGATTLLVSGGFTRKGRLPVDGMISAIRGGKERTGLLVEVHSGVVDNSTIEGLAAAGIDALLLDVIGDDRTIREYLGGKWDVAEYRRTLYFAKGKIPTVAPHVLIGVERGKVAGERNAIDLISLSNADACAILVLISDPPMDLASVKEVMAYARASFKQHLTLGCMRGKGSERMEYEKFAVDLGYDGIANPSPGIKEYAASKGRGAIEVSGCCIFSPHRKDQP